MIIVRVRSLNTGRIHPIQCEDMNVLTDICMIRFGVTNIQGIDQPNWEIVSIQGI